MLTTVIISFLVLLALLQLIRIPFIFHDFSVEGKTVKESFPDISVMLPTYNDESTIIDTLNSINGQSYQGRMNVIVIDDGSNDSTGEKIREWISKNESSNFVFNYCCNEINKSRKSLALNAHLDKATGKYTILLDGDGIVEQEAISKLVQYIENSDDNVAMVSGRTLTNTFNRAPTFVREIQDIEFYHHYCIDRTIQSNLDSTFWCSGALVIIETNALLEDGLHPDVLSEDTVFSCTQLFKRDRFTKYCEEAVVYTEAQPTFRQLYKQRKRWLFAGLEAMSTSNFKMWNNRVELNAITWMYCIEYLLLLPMTAILLPLSIITLNSLGFLVLIAPCVIQIFHILLIENIGIGKPKISSGLINSNHPIWKKILYVIPMQLLNSIAMIDCIIHQLSGRPKFWSTR